MNTLERLKTVIKNDFVYIVCILFLFLLLLIVVSNQQEQINQCNDHWVEQIKEQFGYGITIDDSILENVWQKEEGKYPGEITD